MMIGTCGASARDRRIRHTSRPPRTGRLRSRMMRSGGPAATAASVAGCDDLRFRITPALERVLDQSRDVVLVFDDENPGVCHAPRRSVPAERVARMSKVLIVG